MGDDMIKNISNSMSDMNKIGKDGEIINPSRKDLVQYCAYISQRLKK